jgi:hypothetical protein
MGKTAAGPPMGIKKKAPVEPGRVGPRGLRAVRLPAGKVGRQLGRGSKVGSQLSLDMAARSHGIACHRLQHLEGAGLPIPRSTLVRRRLWQDGEFPFLRLL